MPTVVQEENESKKHAPAGVGGSLLDELVRDGARAMLAAALQAEVAAYVEAFAHEVNEAGRRLVVRNGYHQPTGGQHGGGGGAGASASGQRQAHRRGERRTEAVLVGDPAGVGPQVPAGGRGAAAAVPAWLVQRGFLPGVGAVPPPQAGGAPRLDGGAVRGDGDPADHPVARRRRRVREAAAAGQRLRVPVGRWHSPEGSPGAGQGVPAGDDRRARRRQERAGRAGRRLPRVIRVVGRPAA